MSELDLEPPTPPQQTKIPSDLQLSLAQLKACSPQSADPQVDIIFQISTKNTEHQSSVMYGRWTHSLHIAWETVRCCGTTMGSSCWKPIILKAGVLAGFSNHRSSLQNAFVCQFCPKLPLSILSRLKIFVRIQFAVSVNPKS